MQAKKIKCILNQACDRETESQHLSNFSSEITSEVFAFHKTIPAYALTPLQSLSAMASHLGIRNLWIKDESHRFGLNAFKILGASYAIAKLFEETTEPSLSFSKLAESLSDQKKEKPVFISATDGNHGRAVAYIAEQLNCAAHIYMPRGASAARQHAIRNHGAHVLIIAGNYDDAVRAAASDAKKNEWCLVQDTAWQGYETVPLHIMQGYTTSLTECMQQLENECPTHVFVQAGVGSLAAAMLGFLCKKFGKHRPSFIVAEPQKADCFYQSALKGERIIIGGALDTISAGLSCGEPNPIAWDILSHYADAFIACDDTITAQGMRLLAHPKNGDAIVISGESGAIGMGILHSIIKEPENRSIVEQLKLDSHAKILLISTEGDTDRESYQKIVTGCIEY